MSESNKDADATMKKLPVVVDCDGCGACCMHMGYPAFLLGTSKHPPEEHWLTLPDDLKLELDRFIANYPVIPDGELDGPCFWFDQATRRCKHHDHRPRVCRDFAVGSSGCLDWRDWLHDQPDDFLTDRKSGTEG